MPRNKKQGGRVGELVCMGRLISAVLGGLSTRLQLVLLPYVVNAVERASSLFENTYKSVECLTRRELTRREKGRRKGSAKGKTVVLGRSWKHFRQRSGLINTSGL